MPKAGPVSVRFDTEVQVALQKLAEKEERTLSWLINRIVRDHLKARKPIK